MSQCELMEPQIDVLVLAVFASQGIEQEQRKRVNLSINRQDKCCRQREVFLLWTGKLEDHLAPAILARSKSISGELRRLHGLQHVPGRNMPYERVGMPRFDVIRDVVSQLDQGPRNVGQTRNAGLHLGRSGSASARNGRPEKQKLARRPRVNPNGFNSDGENPGLPVGRQSLGCCEVRRIDRDDS